MQKAVSDSASLVNQLNNQLSASINAIDYVSITSKLGDAQLAELEQKQNAEIDTYITSLDIVKQAQREYSRALLEGDNEAANNAKANVDALLVALRESEPGVLEIIKRQNSEREKLYAESVSRLTDASINLIEGAALS